MRALAEWHFGGGAGYCEGCREQEEPCALGEKGRNGERCPYRDNEPLRADSRAAWELVRVAQGQLRIAPMGGVVGLDMAAVLALGDALGFERAEVAVFLPFIEAGLVTACNRRDE